MANHLIKYSSHTCGLCQRMSFHDRKVAEELGLVFEECYPETEPDNPNVGLFTEFVCSTSGGADLASAVYGWPTYLLVDKQACSTNVVAKYQGAAPKGRFREIISKLIEGSPAQ